MSMEPKSTPKPEREGISPRLIAATVLSVLALIFIFQNNRKSRVQFLFVDVHVRIWVGLLVAVLVGVAIGWLVRGSGKKKEKD
jgi:uncharacterized integral membrane protein